jgi:hypothetical protein
MADDHDADRILQIRVSKNGAETWGDPTYHDLPETGDFKKRIVRRRNGQSRRFAVMLECTSPVAVTILAASVDMDGE